MVSGWRLLVPSGVVLALRSERFRVLPAATTPEVELGAALGLDCAGLPRLVVREWIEASVKLAFGIFTERAATETQIELAARCSIDLRGCSRAVAGPVFGAALRVLSIENADRLALKPGDRVVATFMTGVDAHDATEQVGPYEVSSVRPDGRVYFRGGSGSHAWAVFVSPASAD